MCIRSGLYVVCLDKLLQKGVLAPIESLWKPSLYGEVIFQRSCVFKGTKIKNKRTKWRTHLYKKITREKESLHLYLPGRVK